MGAVTKNTSKINKGEKMIKTIYISGPMSGLPDFNYPKFNRVASGLRIAGNKVVNPAEIAAKLNTNDYETIMAEDLKALEDCCTIYLLKDWHKSPGAKREVARAVELDLNIVLEGDFV